MTDKAISPLRRRLIEDMAIRRLSPKTQHQYIRRIKRFADFVGRSADKARSPASSRSIAKAIQMPTVCASRSTSILPIRSTT